MKCKRACLVINPHAGQNVTKIADLIAVLSAAGWETEITIKEYGGHSMELASRAVKANYDLVIGYGGDGTLNQVLNGVMMTRKHSSVIGVIPGGTVNVWAAEIGVPDDPVQAALTLCSSEARKIDIGHMEVQALSFPGTSQQDQQKRLEKNGKREQRRQKREVKTTTRARHHFLLMAGLGIDAAIMEHVSRSLKYQLAPLALGLSIVEELPRQRPFPVEIRVGGTKSDDDMIWKGEAMQVVVGNTRRYGPIGQMTPNAYLDDGMLDVCVITAGNILTTLEQVASLVFRHRPDNVTGEYFQGASITISVPASIDLQLDGSAVRLKDFLNKSDRKALQGAANAKEVMVTYRFDALPRAVQVAIPTKYDGALFEKAIAEEKPLAGGASPGSSRQRKDEDAAELHRDAGELQREFHELLATLLAHGHRVTVRGVAAHPKKQHSYIIAGTVPHHMTGDSMPVAVQVSEGVTILKRSGEQAPLVMIQELQEGELIVAAGKKSKYGVIRTTHIVI